MAFTITGLIDLDDPEPSAATWDDGDLEADPLVWAWVRARLDDPTPVALSHLGPYYEPSLSEPEPAFALLLDVFAEIVALEGDHPEVPLDRGAVH